jgi:hypothetical protein
MTPMTDDEQRWSRLRNPGGTRGGTGEFVLGLVMLIAGGYLFMDNVIVSSGWGYFQMFGYNTSFGIVFIPLMFGVGFLFFNGRSPIGWVLTVGSTIAIVVGVISHLTIQWRPTTLYYAIAIFVLIAGGIGMIARALRAH